VQHLPRNYRDNLNIGEGCDIDVFNAVKIELVVFWFVEPCSVVVRYRRFGGPCTEKTTNFIFIVGSVVFCTG
jgi:hypothetical protein